MDIHDLLQEMVRRIGIQECLENPSKRSRIRGHDDALQVIRQNFVKVKACPKEKSI